MKFKILIVLIFLLLTVGIYFILQNTNELDCENIGVMFLKSSEKSVEIDDPNIIKVIPEENLIVAKTEVVECEKQFKYYDYLNLDIFGWGEK